MNLKNTLLMAALSLLMSAFTVQAGPAYTIVDLGTLGGNTSNANGINIKGSVVGSSPLPNGDSRAYLYLSGVLHDIGFLGNSKADLSYADAINASGIVVGFSDINPVTGLGHAFLFNGQMHDLGTLGGTYSQSGEGGINALSEVVGWSNTVGDTNFHAFTWTNWKMTDIGTLGGHFSAATGVNSIGEVAGYSTIPGNDSVYHAFLYAYGHMYDLGINAMFQGIYQSVALAINDHSQIVGYDYTVGAEGNILLHHAWLDSADSFKDLGALNPGGESEAFAINNSGEIVGLSTSTSGNHGFLYRGGVMLDVNSLLSSNSGWVITSCNGINDNGQICGDGQHNGLQRSFVMTPTGFGLLP